jgi:hypothetical protein
VAVSDLFEECLAELILVEVTTLLILPWVEVWIREILRTISTVTVIQVVAVSSLAEERTNILDAL